MSLQIEKIYKSLTGKEYIYNIMPIENIPSVIQHGLLSYHRSNELIHTSIAMDDVQSKRENVRFKNGLSLHDYASMYFDYNNPMLYKRKDRAEEICILAIHASVMNLEGCITSDMNGAASMTRFISVEEGFHHIDFNIVFEQYWADKENESENDRHRKIKCAEVLIPHFVPFVYIRGAYVVSEIAKEKMETAGFNKPVFVKPRVFYRRNGGVK